MNEYERAKQLVQEKKKASINILKTGLDVGELTAYHLIKRLTEEGLISAHWNIYLGGYPVTSIQGAGRQIEEA